MAGVFGAGFFAEGIGGLTGVAFGLALGVAGFLIVAALIILAIAAYEIYRGFRIEHDAAEANVV